MPCRDEIPVPNLAQKDLLIESIILLSNIFDTLCSLMIFVISEDGIDS